MANETNETVGTENEGTKINWGKVAVRDPHGAIDKDATLALCDEELTAHMAENEVDMTEIAGTVATVFTKLTRGGEAQKAMIDLDGLATRAFGLLDAPLGSETLLKKRIMDFVRGESLRFVETVGGEGLYHIKRGKDGGVRLNTVAYVAEYRALQAKKAGTPAAPAAQ